MKNFRLSVFLTFSLILCSCTYSINQIHTDGTASDVLDETQSATPDISPTITIPMVPGI